MDRGSNVAVVPARRGSVGVEGKNLRKIGGRPLIVRAVQTALAATSISRVVVSTDCRFIGEAASEAGAEIVRRPATLATATSSSEEAVLHTLDTVGWPADSGFVCMLQCTTPFSRAEDIDRAVDVLLREQADSAFTGYRSHHFLWCPTGDQAGWQGVNHDVRERVMRQRRPLEVVENGAIYVMRPDGFRRTRHRFFGTIAFSEMPRSRSLEVDDEDDLQLARLLAPALDGPNPAADLETAETTIEPGAVGGRRQQVRRSPADR